MFYVYEHWRPDKDICFYVGKGSGSRAALKGQRSKHHRHILKKLEALGMCAEVRLVASNLTETEAYNIEINRIAFWQLHGVKLVNHTTGGDGGYKWSDDLKKKHRRIQRSAETRKRKSDAAKIAHARPEVKAKLKSKLVMTEERRQKISAGNKKAHAKPDVKARHSKACQIGQRRRFSQAGYVKTVVQS